uniref:Uncharacterized protein n=1 Tax=Anguilla anguilla TaxID=7936 RepID=A0A0E9PFV9_ANGAN
MVHKRQATLGCTCLCVFTVRTKGEKPEEFHFYIVWVCDRTQVLFPP